MVCGKETGHAEVVLVEFDPNIVSYAQLVELFFGMHEPDYWYAGSQYRSAIFTFGEAQRSVAERAKSDRIAGGEIVKTEITPASTFWMAEDYHQQYMEKRGLGRASACGRLT